MSTNEIVHATPVVALPATEEDIEKAREAEYNYSARFSEETLDWIRKVKASTKGDFISSYHLRRLVSDGKMVLVVLDDEPVYAGRRVMVTWNGFKLISGEQLPVRIYRLIVDYTDVFSVAFTYFLNKYRSPSRMEMRVE